MSRVGVKPELLRWARERSGRSVDELRSRFPKFDAWEEGEVLPTLKQLEASAKATYTPIGYLFLQEPPVEELPVNDFRTMGNVDVSRPSPDLLDTLYLCQERQDWYRDEVRSAGEEPLEFVGSLNTSDDPKFAGARIRDALGFDVEQRRQSPTWTEALRQFIKQADALGILVMVSGIVGSNTRRKLDPKAFRGFALSDPLAPLVFINGADTKAALIFTLAHEIAHLWLGESGVSNFEMVTSPEHSVERWCNEVAAEFLVPSESIREEFNSATELSREVNRLTRRFKVSTLVILRRIHDVGKLYKDIFWPAYQNAAHRLREHRRHRDSGGGNFYFNMDAPACAASVAAGRRVSNRLKRALVVSTLEGRTSYTESFRLLGIRKSSTFERRVLNQDPMPCS